MLESQESKKKSKYQLTSIQRKAIIGKIYPILLLGSIVWLSGEYLFSFLFSDLDFTGPNLLAYIIIVIVEVILFILFFFTSKNNKTLLSFLLFVTLSFLLGILSIPIVIFTEFLPQVHMFVSLSVGANIIVNLMTLFLRDKYFSKGFIWAHILLFLGGCAIVELVFIFIFNIQNFLLTVPISLVYILIVSLILIFYGVRTVGKVEDDNWTYAFFKILGIILLSLAIAVVIAIIVLIIIACAIASDGALDLSGLGGGGGGTGRKKKKQPKI
ncbi:MAG: hypothetical protein HWN80_13495 [Candidatus Lokiarchaeota archaeon]|nr:hypothetical protein [Candidatus Lokiarchaeota archaeon]